ncbi:ATP-binding protein [Streptomyces sp. NBC_01433]|uniref:ATP-binding protein n=1 Tax=Streptomyces sp. NBC_01433 TaxID=2903864 RepID=UPI002256A700|nr:ATP-binding protein [Streptomyces sp. NBC_01433]MCX4680709.1 ATP-binding protein [Streptomyces sp. NBC_01433]
MTAISSLPGPDPSLPAPAGTARPARPRTGGAAGTARPAPAGTARTDSPPRPVRPAVTELRLAAFASHRRAVLPMGPVTLVTGGAGTGKTTALRAYEALARLGAGDPLDEVFPDPVACVPERAGPDAQGRRGFRLGCTVDGPAGPVRLEVAVQAEPTLRVVGERLTGGGETLMATALRDPRRPMVQAAWHTAGLVPVTRAPLPDDRLATALLPLRVAGTTEGQLQVLAAAEQVVVALRSAFVCDPQPQLMRVPVPVGPGHLRPDCGNLAEVLARTHALGGYRHARLVAAADAGCAGPVTGLYAEELGDGTVRAWVGRDAAHRTPMGRLGDGELRYLAHALVLLNGPQVLEADAPAEVPQAMRALTVLADGLDRNLGGRQLRELLALASSSCGDGHIRLLGTVTDTSAAGAFGTAGVTVVDLGP